MTTLKILPIFLAMAVVTVLFDCNWNLWINSAKLLSLNMPSSERYWCIFNPGVLPE